MKKLLVLCVLVGFLTGCSKGSSAKVTECKTNEGYSLYSSATQTLESEGDIVKVILFEGIIDFNSKEELELTLPQIDESLKSVNSLDGVEVGYELVGSKSLKDKARYDLETASISTLEQLGLLTSDDVAKNTKLISVEKTVVALENAGFVCSEK